MKKIMIAILIVLCLSLIGCSSKAANTTSTASTNADTSNLKTFTLSELEKFNGENGNPAYVAVDGIVYDVSNIPEWKNGKHNGISAGKDVSKAIKSSPHGAGVLKELPVVGKLSENK